MGLIRDVFSNLFGHKKVDKKEVNHKRFTLSMPRIERNKLTLGISAKKKHPLHYAHQGTFTPLKGL